MIQQRVNPEINASSMADIAFLLLIFFLVTTTIDSDKGLTVKLPLLPEGSIPEANINKRNVLNILVNSNDALMVNNKLIELSELRNLAKTFITNAEKEADKPLSPQKAVISLKNNEGTSYQAYLAVHNEIRAVYNQLWHNAAQREYGENYEQLNIEQKDFIKALFPYRISEAEPDS